MIGFKFKPIKEQRKEKQTCLTGRNAELMGAARVAHFLLRKQMWRPEECHVQLFCYGMISSKRAEFEKLAPFQTEKKFTLVIRNTD